VTLAGEMVVVIVLAVTGFFNDARRSACPVQF
jgi:hypothetical protein